MSTLFRSTAGAVVRLGALLGKGGEASVFRVQDDPALAAKIYSSPPDARRESKLRALLECDAAAMGTHAAWPLAGLLGDRGRLVGFVMRLVTDHKPVHHLYSPKSRRIEFPKADYRFIVHSGRNLACAIERVHALGYVLGDVNNNNVLVGADSRACLIDCDSMQVTTSRGVLTCDVGTPTYTPPDLQGSSLSGVVRTRQHDCFGLAVLLFQLLFMGRHPFSGRGGGPVDLSIEDAIQQGLFAYGPAGRAAGIRPPPGGIPFDALPAGMGDMFGRAFSLGSRRPEAGEWVASLESLEGGLRRCDAQHEHYYFRQLRACPWCSLESLSSVRYFNPVFARGAFAAPDVDPEKAWGECQRMPSPGTAPAIEAGIPALPPPGERASRIAMRRRARHSLSWLAGMLCAAALGLRSWWPAVAGIVVWGFSRERAEDRADKAAIAKEGVDAEAQWAQACAQWQREAGDAEFNEVLAELEKVIRQVRELPTERRRKIQVLHDRAHDIQLAAYLDRHLLEDAGIPGIGAGRCATLLAAGVESAADVTASNLENVRGIGHALSARLLAWRGEVERGFHFDPGRAVSPADLAVIDRDEAKQRAGLSAKLVAGRQRLVHAREAAMRARVLLYASIEAARARRAQAMSDARACG